jgi:hypothetical protein
LTYYATYLACAFGFLETIAPVTHDQPLDEPPVRSPTLVLDRCAASLAPKRMRGATASLDISRLVERAASDLTAQRTPRLKQLPRD